MGKRDQELQAIRAFIDRRGIVVTQWLKSAGLGRGTLNNFFKGETERLSSRVIEALAADAGVDPRVLTGEVPDPIDSSPSVATLPRLTSEEQMNLQLMVRLLREISDKQERTNELLVALLSRLTEDGREVKPKKAG